MDFKSLVEIFKNNQFVQIGIILVISFVFYFISKKIINARLKNVKTSNKYDKINLRKRKTYLKLLANLLKYLIFIIDFVIVLKIFGIDVSSIVAGLGIVSVITGLALQDALKDIIAGFNIILDSYFSVGDVIEIDEVQGKVIDIDIKTTKLKDINNGNILVIANRNIVKALTLSDQLDIDIPVPYEEKLDKIEVIIDDIVLRLKGKDKLKDIKYVGTNEFGQSAIYYKLRLWCSPEEKPQMKRDALKIIKSTLDENGISIPYTQIDIHTR